MSKLDSPDLRDVPQELIDWVDKVTEIINFGKYQMPALTSVPSWKGRRGEMVLFYDTTGAQLLVMTSDNSNTWTIIADTN